MPEDIPEIRQNRKSKKNVTVALVAPMMEWQNCHKRLGDI
jgi:hypothetical protein